MSAPDRTPRAAESRPVRVHAVETLADDWFTVRKYRLDMPRRDGDTQRITRLDMHRGDRAGVLLYSPGGGTVVLTSQFRLPVLLRDRPDGQLVEVPGGLLDGHDPVESVRREAEEETGFRVRSLSHAFAVYLAPQLSRERTHLFTGHYDPQDRAGPGGGVAAEGEDVRVLELPLERAIAHVLGQEAADGKTLLLLLHARNQGLCA